MKKILFICLVWLPVLLVAIDADISFIVADLKYNARDGVKICELQTGGKSNILGPDTVQGKKGFFGHLFAESLIQKVPRIWFLKRDVLNSKTREALEKVGGKEFRSFETLLNAPSFIKVCQRIPQNPKNLYEYQGIVLAAPYKISKALPEEYPGVIFIDRAFYSCINNKHLVAKALDKVPEARSLRPAWGLYPKNGDEKVVQKILKEIPSEVLVLKPMNQTLGRGLIIVRREKLSAVIKELFDKHEGRNYEGWNSDNSEEFLVEAFIPSDPVILSDKEDQAYDATMRVTLLFSYSKGMPSLEVFEGHWKLPGKSLQSKGTLMEKHQSLTEAPRYHKVDDEVLVEVKRELQAGLIPFYQSLLKVM
ncbi:MAG: hypothetical protein KDK62_02365 [Chlamydiia bacterium]|nr:hypothetical protein [Chlamydiia bacterium]